MGKAATCVLLMLAMGRADAAPRLFSAAETTKMKKAFDARLAAKSSCPRPVLAGKPRAGSGTAALLAVFDGKDACAVALRKLASGASREPLAALVAKNDPKVAEFEKTCGAKLAASVQAVVAHGDVCSPFELGKTVEGEKIALRLAPSHLLGVHAKALAATDPDAALALLFDTMRFYRDMARGRTSMLLSMLASGADNVLMLRVSEILAATPPQDITAVIARVDVLLADVPTFGTVMANEGDAMTLERAESPFDTDDIGMDPEDTKLLMLFAGDGVARGIAKACPVTASYLACAKGLAAVKAATDPSAELAKAVGDLAHATNPETVRVTIKERVIAILADYAVSRLADYPTRGAIDAYRFIALRFQLEAARTRPCPTSLDTAPWKDLRGVSRLGEPMQMSVAPSEITLTPPAWMKSDKPLDVKFRCYRK